ncbi:MAG: DUF2207 domain-containing protein, partial [Candidatus Bathyarchaeota archaeon]|nr:DUF2207 domain-containing protein [Candidatus Bathyarchaeota archaeon]
MSEQRQILTLVAITLVIGIAALTLPWLIPSSLGEGEAVVDEYRATFYPDGRLVEEYVYSIGVKRFRFLYRVWEVPLSTDALDRPYIQLVEVEAPSGAIGYIKDHLGRVHVNDPYGDDWAVTNSINSLAVSNEAGS